MYTTVCEDFRRDLHGSSFCLEKVSSEVFSVCESGSAGGWWLLFFVEVIETCTAQCVRTAKETCTSLQCESRFIVCGGECSLGCAVFVTVTVAEELAVGCPL